MSLRLRLDHGSYLDLCLTDSFQIQRPGFFQGASVLLGFGFLDPGEVVHLRRRRWGRRRRGWC